MPTRFIGRPAPIYMLGDSQSLVFSQLLFEAEYQQQAVSLLTLARYCPGLSAAQFSDPRGYLHETVIRALLSDCLIDRENRALYQHQSPQSGILSLLAGRTRAAPVLVFFCGSSDLVNVFQRQLGTRYDFVLPDQEHLLAAYPPVQPEQVFPYQTARASLGERLVPLFRGLRKLREMGFAHIYLHDLVPQTPDDLFFSRVYQYACPARTRCKAQLLFNQLLAEQAEAEGFGLIQIWDQVTEQNRLRPEFALDSIHLNKEAAFLTVARLWEHMCRHLPAGYQPIAEQVRESVNEWALGMMQRSLNHEYHQTLALAESATDLMAAVVAAQTHYPEELTSFVLGLEALSRACRALGCLGRLPALVKPFQPLLAQLLPLAEPSARDTVRERWLAHAGTEQASTESNLDRLTLLAAVHELIVP